MRSVKGIFLVGLLVALALGFTQGLPGSTPTAVAATVVACGTSSSVDGEQMILTSNLNCVGTAVTITHNKVHLDMQGFTITGNGTGIGIDVGSCTPTSRVHINGGTVTAFDHGILLCSATNAHVNGMTSTNNDLSGIRLEQGSNNNQINGSTVSFNGTTNIGGGSTDGGIVLFNSNDNKIHTMTIEDNIAFGVLFRFSGGNTISSSVVSDNDFVGIFADRAGGNTIQANTISGNSQGINVSAGGGGDTIRGNTVTNNGNFGLQLRSVRNGVVRGNTISNNGNTGILVFDNSFGNLLQANTALGNGTFDLFDTNSAAGGTPPCDNTWKSNTFVTESDPGGCIQ